jgi:hypothetical protein
MVTHSSTSRPVQCLCMAERTGCPVLTDLWSYVSCCCSLGNMKKMQSFGGNPTFHAKLSQAQGRRQSWSIGMNKLTIYDRASSFLSYARTASSRTCVPMALHPKSAGWGVETRSG